jgi:hypothetical protein
MKTLDQNVAILIAEHLREEERLLADAKSFLGAAERHFAPSAPLNLDSVVSGQSEITQRFNELQNRRLLLRKALMAGLNVAADDVRLSRILERIPIVERNSLQVQLTRVKSLASELAGAIHRLSLRVRIFLAAYHQLLLDLTGTSSGSGRYGPYGKTESQSYRPLIQVHG